MGLCCACCKRFAAEWKREALDYNDLNRGEWVDVFGTSSCRFLQDRTAYSTFRLVEAFAITAIYGWSWGKSLNKGNFACYYIYLTHWSLTLQLFYFWLAWWTTRQCRLMASGAKPKQHRMPWYARATWVLQDLVIPGSFMVFVLFWVLVAPAEQKGPVEALAYFTHGVNFLLQIVEVFLSRQPYHLLHGIYIVIFGAVYFSFSGVYYAAGGTACNGKTYIYKALDWSMPNSVLSLMLLILFVVVPVINVAFWCVIAMFFPRNYKEPAAVKEVDPETIEIEMA